MASVKLTNEMRDEITNRLVRYRFHDEIANLHAEYYKFAIEVYCYIYPSDVRRKMEALPEGWLPSTNRFMVQFAGGITHLRLDGEHNDLQGLFKYAPDRELPRPEIAQRRFPTRDSNTVIQVFDAGHMLSKRYASLESNAKDLRSRVQQTRQQTRAATGSATTLNKLLTLWPELEPFVADMKDESGSFPPPAVPVDKLNSMLNLPKEENA